MCIKCKHILWYNIRSVYVRRTRGNIPRQTSWRYLKTFRMLHYLISIYAVWRGNYIIVECAIPCRLRINRNIKTFIEIEKISIYSILLLLYYHRSPFIGRRKHDFWYCQLLPPPTPYLHLHSSPRLFAKTNNKHAAIMYLYYVVCSLRVSIAACIYTRVYSIIYSQPSCTVLSHGFNKISNSGMPKQRLGGWWIGGRWLRAGDRSNKTIRLRRFGDIRRLDYFDQRALKEV